MNIGSGIKIYFSNSPQESNIIFFRDNDTTYRQDGDILIELSTDEAMHLLTEKAENMIRLYPGRDEPLSVDSITDGFQWLYGTVQDDDLPITTELFRSSFNEVIQHIGRIPTVYSAYKTTGEFFDACYAEHLERISLFAALLETLAAAESNTANDLQKALADDFRDSADSLYEEYSKSCHHRSRNGHTTIETYQVTNLFQVLYLEYCRLKRAKKVIKCCANCGRLFVPAHRKDTKYCSSPAPQNPEKACSAIGRQAAYNARIRKSPGKREHKNRCSQLSMAAKRAEDNGDIDIADYFRTQLADERKKMKNREKENTDNG